MRRGLVIPAGGVLLAVFAFRLRDHLIDEMPLFALAAWIGVVVLARASRDQAPPTGTSCSGQPAVRVRP